MTLRALILGLLGAAFIAGFGYVNDQVFKLTSFVGNFFPISVFGLLFVFVLAVNPLLYMVRKSWRLAPNELAVILAMMLVACSIPGSGLMRTFTPVLAMPVQYGQDNSGWKKNRPPEPSPADDKAQPPAAVAAPAAAGNPAQNQPGALASAAPDKAKPAAEAPAKPTAKKAQKSIVNYVPAVMLPAGGDGNSKVIQEFQGGVQRSDMREMIGLKDIPWHGWATPLKVWVPLILLLGVAVISLSVLVHRQWGHRERLRYPIAEVAESLVSQEPERAVAPIFRNKLFWIGLSVVVIIHLVNGLYQWTGSKTILIPLKLTMEAIGQKYPALQKANEQGHHLTNPEFFPTVIAFGFFLASDVGLSLGLSQMIFISLWMLLNTSGFPVSRDWMTGGVPDFQRFGSYLGVGLILFYMGRRYYWDTLRKALVPWLRHETERSSVWACRVFILATSAVILLLALVGLDWPVAVVLVGLILLTYLVMARINAESGLFFIQAYWVPAAVLFGLFGMTSLGPKAFIIAGLISVLLVLDAREALMPFVVNGLKIADDLKVRPGRVGWAAVAALTVGMTVAVPVVLWSNYNYGVNRDDKWAVDNMPKYPYDAASNQIDQLRDAGELDKSLSFSGMERLTNMRPQPYLLWGAGAGILLVLVFSVLRLRFTWWPLHPILFLVWGTYPMAKFSASFLLGWAIKAAVTKLGGGQKYRGLIPLMIGIIAGDLLGGLYWTVQGTAYYFYQGQAPLSPYKIFPG